MSAIGSGVWILGPQLVVPFWEIVHVSGGEVWQLEVGYGGRILMDIAWPCFRSHYLFSTCFSATAYFMFPCMQMAYCPYDPYLFPPFFLLFSPFFCVSACKSLLWHNQRFLLCLGLYMFVLCVWIHMCGGCMCAGTCLRTCVHVFVETWSWCWVSSPIILHFIYWVKVFLLELTDSR